MKNSHELFDITLTISENMPVWSGDPTVALNKKRTISGGDSCNVTQIDIGSHTGTHIDAPYHFEEDGDRIDMLALDTLIGNVRVFDMAKEKEISVENIKDLNINGITRVFFRTTNSDRWKLGVKEFTKDFVSVTGEAARFLVNAGVKLVGVDYLSIEKFGNKSHDTHHTLLKNGVIIIEGLDLSDISAGDYELIALPLKLKDGDGSPARVVLRKVE